MEAGPTHSYGFENQKNMEAEHQTKVNKKHKKQKSERITNERPNTVTKHKTKKQGTPKHGSETKNDLTKEENLNEDGNLRRQSNQRTIATYFLGDRRCRGGGLMRAES